MSTAAKHADLDAGCQWARLGGVPAAARHVLEVGGAEKHPGAPRKGPEASRSVFGVEGEPEVAARASLPDARPVNTFDANGP